MTRPDPTSGTRLSVMHQRLEEDGSGWKFRCDRKMVYVCRTCGKDGLCLRFD